MPKLPLPRTLIKLKSLRVLLWICPFSRPPVDDAVDKEVVEVAEEDDNEHDEEFWAPCWSSDSVSCSRSNSAKSEGGTGHTFGGGVAITFGKASHYSEWNIRSGKTNETVGKSRLERRHREALWTIKRVNLSEGNVRGADDD